MALAQNEGVGALRSRWAALHFHGFGATLEEAIHPMAAQMGAQSRSNWPV